jgi:hypothetical protein
MVEWPIEDWELSFVTISTRMLSWSFVSSILHSLMVTLAKYFLQIGCLSSITHFGLVGLVSLLSSLKEM